MSKDEVEWTYEIRRNYTGIVRWKVKVWRNGRLISGRYLDFADTKWGARVRARQIKRAWIDEHAEDQIVERGKL